MRSLRFNQYLWRWQLLVLALSLLLPIVLLGIVAVEFEGRDVPDPRREYPLYLLIIVGVWLVAMLTGLCSLIYAIVRRSLTDEATLRGFYLRQILIGILLCLLALPEIGAIGLMLANPG